MKGTSIIHPFYEVSLFAAPEIYDEHVGKWKGGKPWIPRSDWFLPALKATKSKHSREIHGKLFKMSEPLDDEKRTTKKDVPPSKVQVQCSHCGSSLRKDRLKEHCKKFHPGKSVTSSGDKTIYTYLIWLFVYFLINTLLVF